LGVVVAVVVVVVEVPEELELLDESSFFAQEMMMRLKRDMRIMDKTLFIFSSIPKVKYYGLVLGEPNIYHDSGVFYKCVWILLGGCLTVKK
jgi:hypothetical protein